ncbi:MAG TPA: PAS domain-containing sensor histidine kinase [Candidatus Omnitrophica bacterium]|nr:PAS domain-containing sensor histidine kinase [Candidatus Omnitrophota bacterium]
MALYPVFLLVIFILLWQVWLLKKRERGFFVELADIKAKLAERTKAQGSGQAQQEAILSSMAEGVLVLDKKGGIVLMNPSLRKNFFVDITPEGRKPLEVTRNIVVGDMADMVLKGQGKAVISREISVQGQEEKIFKVNGVPIVQADSVEGAILVFHDITELRRLERLRQDFVANVSHELRTPLSSIKGYAETLLEGALDDKANARDFVGIIHHDSERLSKLIDDLLDLSKIESGKMKMVFLPVELQGVIRRIAAVLENQAKSKAISVSVDAPAGLPKVMADESRLSQVILNLLDNAVKYTPQGGSVKISARIDNDFVRVGVSDTGIGIPDEDVSRIFERFYRVDKARSRELGGTGLGLSIVKHIVSAHNGQVWVSSEPGKGSTFSFTIPTTTQ